jgi:predicted MPP superfamily phosphohydrolase
MKTTQFIIFFSIVLLVYFLVNLYIFVRGFQAIPAGSVWRTWFPVIFWSLAFTFILARVLERLYPSALSMGITWIGSFWLGFMLFFFLSVVLIDLFRIFNSFLHFFPAVAYADPAKTRLITFLAVLGISTILVTIGFINARIPGITEMDLTIRKPKATPGELIIVMASDIHLGTIIAGRKANRLVEKINSLHPDIVLLAGDVVDEDIQPVVRNNLGESLRQLRAPMGVYAITGNHEFIGGVDAAVKYLEEHGIRMLRDTVVFIDGKFWLAGRDDRDKVRFTGIKRKELNDILGDIDRDYPLILMDHQPFSLEVPERLGVDLQLSGHTHHGQVWPFNYITKAIYEVSSGYKKIGNMHVYVSCGYGTWGPPVRIGNRPEIVKLSLKFLAKKN